MLNTITFISEGFILESVVSTSVPDELTCMYTVQRQTTAHLRIQWQFFKIQMYRAAIKMKMLLY